MIDVILPIPPSVNALYANSRRAGRIRRPHYIKWIESATYYLRAARQPHMNERYALLLMLPEGMKGDVDNRVKAVSDLLVATAHIPDDKNADATLQIRVPGLDLTFCRVVVFPSGEFYQMIRSACQGLVPASRWPEASPAAPSPARPHAGEVEAASL